MFLGTEYGNTQILSMAMRGEGDGEMKRVNPIIRFFMIWFSLSILIVVRGILEKFL